MTLVGVLGVLFGLLGLFWMTSAIDNRKIAVWALISVIHVGSALIYYDYVQTNDADTKLYYYDLYNFYALEFEPGTLAVVYFTQFLKQTIGGTYLDYFLLYQMFGLWGLAFLFRMFEDLARILGSSLLPQVYVMLLFPGMYFWTSAIGKDAPLFLACSMAVWSCFAINRRWFWLGMALLIMALVRPHIALVTMGALALAVVFGRGVSLPIRVLLVMLSLVGTVYLAGTIQSQIELVTSSTASIANFVEVASNAAGEGGEGSLARSNFLVKLFSVLFRPLFVDTDSLFGLIASFQNLGMLAIAYFLGRNFKLWAELFKESFLIRFATIHFVALYLMLALMYYNVGLGLRQREMATPALLVLTFAMLLVTERRRHNAMVSSPRTPTGAIA